jgi:F-type H+-transporting ATPase subunit b
MPRSTLLILSLAALAGLGTTALGAGDGVVTPIPPVKEGLASAITALVVFTIVLFILATKVWPLITGGLDDRNAKIREEIASAEASRAQAKAALAEYEASLAQARFEAQKMLDETRTEQTRLAAELKAKADRELNEMREKAKRDIESAKKAALGEIYAESVQLATRMAGKILQREVSHGDGDRLLDESLAELGRSRAN